MREREREGERGREREERGEYATKFGINEI